MAEPQSLNGENTILAKNSPQQQEEDSHTQNNPFLSFVSNILQLFKPPAPKKNGTTTNNVSESDPSIIGASVNETVVEDESKPVVVKFPRQSSAPLKIEAEAEGGEQNTNPVILWFMPLEDFSFCGGHGKDGMSGREIRSPVMNLLHLMINL
ncbi:uncharacterized protein LOC111365253 [Olea europaea subsp. europaea]|uniref:Uncharacterized protein LOC111365253 n=1 Tax=Olea europaea subsp. europaea TaxID=158383 RepID=A0A8S0PBM6_OLEEU|nr:uncharacterized protein LOC111365253 [Olea europaea subsp. europaea]